MDKNILARFHTESILYDDLFDLIEIDTENKRYWLFLNSKPEAIDLPDQNGKKTKSLPVERFIFDIILNAVKEQYEKAEPKA